MVLYVHYQRRLCAWMRRWVWDTVGHQVPSTPTAKQLPTNLAHNHTQTQVPLTAPSHRKTLSLPPVPAHHHSVSTGHCLPLNTTNTTNTSTPTTPAPHNHTHQPSPQLHRPSTLAAAVTPTVRICSHGSHDGARSAARRELLPHRLADTIGGVQFCGQERGLDEAIPAWTSARCGGCREMRCDGWQRVAILGRYVQLFRPFGGW